MEDDAREKLLKIIRCGIFVGGGSRASAETRAAHAAAALDAYDRSRICMNCGGRIDDVGEDVKLLDGTLWASK